MRRRIKLAGNDMDDPAGNILFRKDHCMAFRAGKALQLCGGGRQKFTRPLLEVTRVPQLIPLQNIIAAAMGDASPLSRQQFAVLRRHHLER